MVLVGTGEDLRHEIIVRFVLAEFAIMIAIGLREAIFSRGITRRRLTGNDCSQKAVACWIVAVSRCNDRCRSRRGR